jgi:hypothetical protein
VEVFSSEGEQDLKCSRRQWIEFSFRHIGDR